MPARAIGGRNGATRDPTSGLPAQRHPRYPDRPVQTGTPHSALSFVSAEIYTSNAIVSGHSKILDCPVAVQFTEARAPQHRPDFGYLPGPLPHLHIGSLP